MPSSWLKSLLPSSAYSILSLPTFLPPPPLPLSSLTQESVPFFFFLIFSSLTVDLSGFNGYPDDGESDFAGCGWAYALLAWIWTGFFFLLKDPAKFGFYRFVDLFVRGNVFLSFSTNKTKKKQTSCAKYIPPPPSSSALIAHPVRRTKKVFGHPVYGRHGRKALHFGSMWPQMTMEPPAPEDVAEVAAGLRRASLDLVEVSIRFIS